MPHSAPRKDPRPDQRRGGIITGLLFAGFMVFMALLVAGVVVTRSVRVRTADGAGGKDITIDTPGGHLNIRARDRMNPEVVGIPVYPGAWRANGAGGASFEWSSSNGDRKDLSVIGGEYRTRDSAHEVLEFYRKQLPSLLIVSETNHATNLEYKDGGIKRIISISERDGETRIGVASIGGRESN